MEIFTQLGVDSSLPYQFVVLAVAFILANFLFLGKLQEVLEVREEKTVKLENSADETLEKVTTMQAEYKAKVDEANSPDNEDNVFIFSKIEKGAKPDKMTFQRFTKVGGDWKVVAKKQMTHDGILSAWGQRKAFADDDKDKSIDALFIYALNDYDFKQQSVHLIFSKNKGLYEISSSAESGYTKDI